MLEFSGKRAVSNLVTLSILGPNRCKSILITFAEVTHLFVHLLNGLKLILTPLESCLKLISTPLESCLSHGCYHFVTESMNWFCARQTCEHLQVDDLLAVLFKICHHLIN